MAKKLVIVESSTKASTINKILGDGYLVRASVGHVRDLPRSQLAVDVDNDFQPVYEVIRGKQKVLTALRKVAREADEILLAADPDREGEAICWHLAEELVSSKKPIRRVAFNEITQDAVREAMDSPRDIDGYLVDAQKARRVLDRVVGYQISPLLWRNVRRGLSAGRVQSVAVRIICDREAEIRAFVPEEYWTITANVQGEAELAFDARLLRIGDEKGTFGTYGFGIDEARANEIVSDVRPRQLVVRSVKKQERKQSPRPPFTTSTMQQEASRKLSMTTRRSMQVAQGLYEGAEIGTEGSVGLITYMRTDSTRVADVALQAVREYIGEAYGSQYRPQRARNYATKKGAQDAHEAVRPTDVQRTPDSLRSFLSPPQHALYELIWRRFVASQMADAILDRTTIEIHADDYVFRATGQVIRFPGFRQLYMESADSDENGDGNQSLPEVREGEILDLRGLTPGQHFTQPPPRFNEATLVREMEERGIGRPSTYAAIISRIQDVEYVEKAKGRFQPTEIGELVTRMLVKSFPDILDADFTAKMEGELDDVEEGHRDWVSMMREFYGPFTQALDAASDKMYEEKKSLEELTDVKCEKCGSPMVVKWGRYGKFLGCSRYPDCKSTQPLDGGKPAPEPVGTGVPCPQCGNGELMGRRSRRGKEFFGCSEYPKCDFAVWDPPVKGEPCPECDAPFLTHHRTKTRQYYQCYRRKECGYKSPAEAVEEDEEPLVGDDDGADARP